MRLLQVIMIAMIGLAMVGMVACGGGNDQAAPTEPTPPASEPSSTTSYEPEPDSASDSSPSREHDPASDPAPPAEPIREVEPDVSRQTEAQGNDWEQQIAAAAARLDFTQARHLAQEAAAASEGAASVAYADQAVVFSRYVQELPQVRRLVQDLAHSGQRRAQALAGLLQGGSLVLLVQRAVIDPQQRVTEDDTAIMPAVLELTRVQQDVDALPAIMARYELIDPQHRHHSDIIATLTYLAGEASNQWLQERLAQVAEVGRWQDRDMVDILLGMSRDESDLDQRLGTGAHQRLRDFIQAAFTSEDAEAHSWALSHAAWAGLSQPGFTCVWWENRDFEDDPDLFTVESRLHWESAGAFPHQRTTDISGRMEGFFIAPQSGSWTFFTNSDDGSRLYIDGEEVVDNWGLHGMQVRSGTIDLIEGQRYDIRIDWFQAGGGAGLIVTVQPPGGEEQPLDDSLIHSIPRQHP